jgi:hypothetical protein
MLAAHDEAPGAVSATPVLQALEAVRARLLGSALGHPDRARFGPHTLAHERCRSERAAARAGCRSRGAPRHDSPGGVGGDEPGGALQSFARLFLMPGSQHCGGGPSTSTIDPLSSVVNWVENDIAPTSLLGTAPTATPWPGRTRPLCPFSQYAHYDVMAIPVERSIRGVRQERSCRRQG